MKMIRYASIVFLVLLLFATTAFAEAPAPFCKAKEYALKMNMDSEGDYVWEFSKNGDGQQIRYALVYLAQRKVILIARNVFVVAYMEETKELGAATFMGYGFVQIEKSREEIIEFAFRIFRELVEAGAI